MRLADWVSLFGLVFGPVAAVIISLWLERRRAVRERQSTIMRTLLASRRQPADFAFHASINTAPIDFRGNDKVLAAWEAYIAAANKSAPADNPALLLQTTEATVKALDELVIAMLRALGHKERAAREIVRSGYDPNAAVDARNLQAQVLRSVVRVADAVERSASASEVMVARLAATSLQEGAAPSPEPPLTAQR
jgi:hypothetical protein